MKRPFAYVTAAWGEDQEENIKNAVGYCRELYELGYTPLCPALSLSLFLSDESYQERRDKREMARAFLWIQTLTMFTMSYQMPVNAGIIRGGGDTRFILILDIVSIIGIVLPLASLAAFVWNMSPVVVSFILNSDQVFKCIPAFIRVNSYRWIRRLTR